MGDTTRGLYGKFQVSRVDGTDKPGGKHFGCQYFVLDVDHDPAAIPALRAYVRSVRRKYPKLAEDLTKLIVVKTGQFFQSPSGHGR